MRNDFLVLGVVCGMFFVNISDKVCAEVINKYNGTQLPLNTQIVNPTVRQTNQQVQNKVSSVKKLQLDGSVEKNNSVSIYHNQSQQELQLMLENIGNNIIRKNNINIKIGFKYDPSNTINANTNASNVVTVYKGLIQACRNEDELAYVIGHEIGHATSKHIVKSVIAKQGSNYAQNLAGTAIRMVTGNKWAALGVDTLAKTTADLGEKKYSRVHEDDADLSSLDYIVKAGYNPLAAISILYRIGADYVDVLSDHPSTDKRIIKTYNYIKQKYPQFIQAGYDDDSYQEALKLHIQSRKVIINKIN